MKNGIWSNEECITSCKATIISSEGLILVSNMELKSLKGILKVENIATIIVF